METSNKNKYSGVIKGGLFAILVFLIIFAFGQAYVIYQKFEQSYSTLSQAFAKQSWLTRSYVDLYHQTESTLASITKELDTTKGLLSQTETMLNQAKNDNAALQDQVLALQKAQQIGNQVNQLMEESSQASNELVSIHSQLRSVDGNFNNVEEGKNRLALLQQKILSIKNRIGEIKHEAFLAKKAAQEESDRIALLNGNQGYLVKDGQIFQPQAAKSQSKPNVNINVSFFEQ